MVNVAGSYLPWRSSPPIDPEIEFANTYQEPRCLPDLMACGSCPGSTRDEVECGKAQAAWKKLLEQARNGDKKIQKAIRNERRLTRIFSK
tara:strand:+ start:105 stop:374 length:270 start_codon:yes stop_codon:yes gene_type:complete